MNQTFLNTKSDMEWLFSTHLANRFEFKHFHSAILYGNEDCPEKVDLFFREEPLVSDEPHTITFI
jgi:hypothetical protein